jgi:CRISPR-associated protein (TIGR02710 family)
MIAEGTLEISNAYIKRIERIYPNWRSFTISAIVQGTETQCFEISGVVVEDLLLNAERRSQRGRYDDGVGRLYRALELLAQVRLKLAYGLKTENIDRSKLPEAAAHRYAKVEGKLQMPLHRSYELLTELGNDPLGDLYESHEKDLTSILKIRNKSLFAHGFTPISASQFTEVDGVMGEFIRKGIQACIGSKLGHLLPVQFPARFDE